LSSPPSPLVGESWGEGVPFLLFFRLYVRIKKRIYLLIANIDKKE
jgi:hypothetical protein